MAMFFDTAKRLRCGNVSLQTLSIVRTTTLEFSSLAVQNFRQVLRQVVWSWGLHVFGFVPDLSWKQKWHFYSCLSKLMRRLQDHLLCFHGSFRQHFQASSSTRLCLLGGAALACRKKIQSTLSKRRLRTHKDRSSNVYASVPDWYLTDHCMPTLFVIISSYDCFLAGVFHVRVL